MGPKTELSQSTPLQKLPAPPGLAEIHQFLQMAMDHPGQSVEIRWNSRDLLARFVLTVTCPMQGKDIKWVLQAGQEDRLQPVWNYTSCDVLLVYNLIACASQVDDQVLSAVENAQGGNSGAPQAPVGTALDHMIQTSTEGPSIPHETSAEISGRYSLFAETTELSGDFLLVPPSSVLRSILEGKLTGCLQIQSGTASQVSVFCKKGAPYFAESSKLSGEECIMDLLSWRAGKYLFKHRATNDKKNIAMPAQTLIERGVQLARLSDIMKFMGLTPETVLIKKSQHVGMAALSATRPPDAPFSIDQLCQLYEAIDNGSAVTQLAKRCNMPRSIWTPVVSHLLDSGIISFSNDQPTVKETTSTLVGKVIDMSLIHSVIMSLRRADTGMFTYPAFLYFIEQEYFRCYRTGSALSLMILDLRVTGDASHLGRDPLDIPAMAEVFRRVSKVKRGIDIMAHYEQQEYALILPNTAHAGAYTFAKRVHKELTATPLPGVPANRLSVAMGIASIPKDCGELNRLMAAAEAAKAQSTQRRTPIVLYEASQE